MLYNEARREHHDKRLSPFCVGRNEPSLGGVAVLLFIYANINDKTANV